MPENNLKSQLSDIQKRLAETTFSTPKRATPQKEDDTPESVSPSADKKLGPLKSFPSVVSRRDKRVSLPALDGNRSLSTPSKGTGKDMDFVVGLSENLLQECRRLQADNMSKSQKLRAVEDEFNKLKLNNSNLMAKLNDTMMTEERYKDSNWELEMKLQQLSEEHKVISENYQKAQRELNKHIDLSNEIRTELEEANLNKVSLENEYSSTRLTSTSEIQELKSHVDELNDVNTRLNDEIDELRQEMNALKNKPEAPRLKQIPILEPMDDSDSDDGAHEPPVSPVKTISLNNNALESETLRASLQSAHQTITKLRSQILKLRQNELISKQQVQSGTPKKTTPLIKKSIKNFNDSKGTLHMRGHSNRGSTVIFDDSLNSSDPDEEWENFEGNTTIESSSPSKRPERPISMISASRELLDESGSDEDIESFPMAPLSSELHTISEGDIQNYVQQKNLVLIPSSDYSLLSEASKALNSKEEQIAKLSNQLSQHEQTDQLYAKEAEEYRKKLEDALEDLKKENAAVVDLKTQLDAPSEEFIHAKASEKSLKLVPIIEYSKLLRDVELAKLSMENMSVEKAGLQDKLDTNISEKSGLQKSLESHSAEKSELQRTLEAHITEKSDLQKTLNIHVAEKTELQKSLDSHINEKTELQTALDSHVSEIEQLQESHTNVSAENTELQKSVEILSTEKSDLQESIDHLSSTKTSLETSLAGLVAEKSVLEDKLRKLSAETSELQQSISTLSSSKAEIQNAYDTLMIEKTTLQDRYDEVHSSHQKALEEVNVLKESQIKNTQRLSELERMVNSPSIDYIKLMATGLGLVAFDVGVHEKRSKDVESKLSAALSDASSARESHDLTKGELEDKSKALENLSALHLSVHSDLQSKSEELASIQKDYDLIKKDIESKALDLESLQRDHDLLKSDTESNIISLESIQKENDLMKTVVSEKESELESAKTETLSVKAELDSTQSQLSTKILEIEDLQTKLDDLTRDSTKTIEALKTDLSSAEEEFQEKSSISDQVVQELRSKLAAAETKHEELTTSVASSQQKLNASADEIIALKDQMDNPANEFLIEKATQQGFSIIPKDEHTNLLDRANKSIHDLAIEGGFAVLKEVDHKDLTEKATSPSLDHLTALAAEYDHVILQREELAALQTMAEKSVETLAKEKNLVLTPETEHKALLRKLDEPTYDELVSSSKALGLVVVPETEYNDTVQKANNPTVDDILPKALALGFSVVGASELGKLKSESAQLTDKLDMVKSLESNVCLLEEEGQKKDSYIEELTTALNEKEEHLKREPTLPMESLLKQVGALGLVALSTSEHKKLREPTRADILKLASSHNLALIPESDLDNLKSEASKTIDDLAAEKKKIVLSEGEHAILLNPPRSEIEKHAASHGLVVTEKVAFDDLKEKSEKTIQQHAKDSNVVLLSEDEHKRLVAPTMNDLSALAETHGSVLISKESFDDISSKSKRTVHDLAEESGVVVLSQDDHRSLSKPSKDTILGLLPALGLAAVTADELKKLKSTSDTPTMEFLTEKADKLNMTLVEKEHLAEIVANSNKSVDEKAKESNLVLVTNERYNDLLHPSVEKLQSHASGLDHVVVPKNEFDKKKDIGSLELKDVENRLGDLGYIAVPRDEHIALLEPSIESLQSHASNHGHVIIANKEHAELLNPPFNSIAALASNMDHILIPKSEHTELLAPSIEKVQQIASNMDHVVIPKTDHDSLLTPTIESIQSHAGAKDHVVISKDNHNELLAPSIEKLQSHAAEADHVVVPREEFSKKRDIESLEVDDIRDRLDVLGYIAVDKPAHGELLSPSIDKIQAHASTLDHAVLPREELAALLKPTVEQIESHADMLDHVVLSKDVHNELLNPSVEKIQSFATSMDHVVIPTDEFSKKRDIESLEIKDVENRLGALGFVAVSKAEYDHLVSPLNKDVLETQAAELGCVVLGKDEHEKLAEPDQNTVLQLCEKYDLHVIQKEAFDKLSSESHIIERAENLGYATIPREEFHVLTSRADEPDRATIEAQANKLGYALVGKNEFDAYEKSLTKISKSDLDAKAQKIDHVVIPFAQFEELRALTQPTMGTPTTPTSKFNATKEYFENVTKSAEKENSKAKVFESARSLGFVPVAADEYKHLIEHQKDHVITKSDIYTSAKGFSLTVLPSDEYKTLLKSRQKDEITLEELELYAKQFDLKLVDVNSEVKKTPEEMFIGSNRSVSTLSSAFNESDFTDALSRQPSNASTIHAADARIGSMTADELQVQASLHGFKLVPVGGASDTSEHQPELGFDTDSVINAGDDDTDEEDDKHDTLVLAQSPVIIARETLNSQAEELGLIVMDKSEYEHLTGMIDRDELEQKAHDMGLKVVDQSEFVSVDHPEEHQVRDLSSRLGLVTLSQDELANVRQAAISSVKPEQTINESNIFELGSTLGLKVVPIAEYSEILDRAKPVVLSKESLIASAGPMGLVAIDTSEYEKLKSEAAEMKKNAGLITTGVAGIAGVTGVATAAVAGLAAAAVSNSHGVMTANSAKAVAAAPQIKEVPRELSKGELVQGVESHGLVTMSASEVETLKRQAELSQDPSYMTKVLEKRNMVVVPTDEFNSLKEPVEVSSDEVETWARQHDLLLIPEGSFVATNVSRIPDPDNVVVLPTSYYNKLTKSETLSLDKITNDELQAQAKKRGFHITSVDPSQSGISSPQVGLTRKNSSVSLVSSQSRKNLSELSQAAARDELDQQSIAKLSRATSRGTHSRVVTPGMSRDMSVDGVLSLITNASLSEPNIIPALTQAVIGEYLYKYYRRLGPFSSISESRHERYFWIHPYTLTLYWSTTNPVLGNPSTHKTRAAAIIGVESVDDNNPLPAGLYHKSIVVHSQSRSVKFTCPTRQRHNIWYNSLRYLIQRSMDGIDLDDDLAIPVPTVAER